LKLRRFGKSDRVVLSFSCPSSYAERLANGELKSRKTAQPVATDGFTALSSSARAFNHQAKMVMVWLCVPASTPIYFVCAPGAMPQSKPGRGESEFGRPTLW